MTLLLGGPALGRRGLRAAGRVAAARAAALARDLPGTHGARRRLPRAERLPYLPEFAEATLASGAGLVLAGARIPWRSSSTRRAGAAGWRRTACRWTSSRRPADDAVDALERLAERLGAAASGAAPLPAAAAPRGDGPLTPQAVAAILAAAQPEGAIVVDEGITLSQPLLRRGRRPPRATPTSR